VGHAFANPSGDNYTPSETVDAWAKTLDFLREYVRLTLLILFGSVRREIFIVFTQSGAAKLTSSPSSSCNKLT